MSNLKNDFDEQREEIAIIGMAGRFPGAGCIEEFWQNLKAGVESVRSFTTDELQAAGVEEATFKDPSYVNSGTVLDDADFFDAEFFGINPREAEVMDPQHRVFLECAWEALENAGYDVERFNGLVGVFGGVAPNTYFQNNLAIQPKLLKTLGRYTAMIGNEKDFLTTRVSFKMNLKGPSVNVSTACSTSGVAIHLACQSLLSGECDIALVGGARVQVPLKSGHLNLDGGILSSDGHCRAFDKKGSGIIIGNGVGIIVLKRLSESIHDGNTVHALIKGTAINNDGSQKVGFTAPSVQGQANAIAEALAMADVNPDSIGYIEAHGTGTSLGDPIEIAALTKAFREGTRRKGFCPIGSLKTNIGHLDAGAGVAGVIKTVLALKNKLLPPSLNFETPNPQIDFDNSPFYVNDRLSEWTADGTPRRAGVSSFGLGGTNAHIILEEAPLSEASSSGRPWKLLVLSAKTDKALDHATKNLVAHFKKHPDLNLADVAYTLQLGRRAFNHRRMLVCRNIDDAITAMETLDPKRVASNVQDAGERPVVFMFSGQGSQYSRMGSGLYQVESLFREQVDSCAEILKPHLGLDIRHLLYPPAAKMVKATEQLNQTHITQPALFVIEYALAKLWMAWGVHPRAMIGHSIGEYVAACLAGVFSLQDALAIAAARGRLMQQLPNGAMLAIPLPEEEVRLHLGDQLSIAAVNGPSLCVVSGPLEAIEAMQGQFVKRGVACRRLHTSHAFHSSMMDPILETFTEQVKKIKLQAPQTPYISNVSGTWVTDAEATDPAYWAKHIRQTVQFFDGLQAIMQDSDGLLLEVGAGQTLSTFARRHPARDKGQTVVSSLRHPKEQTPDLAFMLNSLGRLWLAGANVEWSQLYASEPRQRVPLPTYPFEKKRYWIEAPTRSKEAEVNLTYKTEAGPEVIENLLAEDQNSKYSPPINRKDQIITELKNRIEDLGGIDPTDLDKKEDYPDNDVSLKGDQWKLDLEAGLPALSRRESELERELDIKAIDDYDGLERDLNDLCSAYLCRYFESCDIEMSKGSSYEVSELQRILRISPKFEKFFHYMLKILSEDRIIELDSGTIQFLKDRADLEDPQSLKDALMKNHPQFKGVFEMLDHCVKRYRDALSGDMPAIQVLFPDGSRDLIKRNLEDNTVEHQRIRIYKRLTEELILKLSANSPVRILEVGAGSGSLTWQLAPALQGRDVTYYFTDIGRTFVNAAKKEAARRGLGMMKFGVLDISQDPEKQGFAPESFDIVLALNVVHATPDIGATLGNIKNLLNPKGLICLIETVKAHRWTNLIWGTTEGWWNFHDRYREDLPLVDLDLWEKASRNQNFGSVQALPFAAAKRSKTDSGLIIAHKKASEKSIFSTSESIPPIENHKVLETGNPNKATDVDLGKAKERSDMSLPVDESPSKEGRKSRILSLLKETIHELSGIDVESLDQHATFLELGFDSLFLTGANAAFRRKFGVKITFRQLFEEVPSLDSLASYIDRHLPSEKFAEEVAPAHSALKSESVSMTVSPVGELMARNESNRSDEKQVLTHPLQPSVASNSLEEVIARQLEIMSAQIELLRRGSLPVEKALATTESHPERHAVANEKTQAAARAGQTEVGDAPKTAENVKTQIRGFGPFTPIKKKISGELTADQRRYLDSLIDRYTSRTKKSKRLAQAHRRHLADPRTVAGFRRHWKEIVYPISTVRASGARIWDVDGNEYVDISMGFGVNLFGHAPDFVYEAVQDQLKKGTELVGRSPLAGKLADLICELTNSERLTYCQTASEAVLGALRAARTVTGRDRIAMFAGAYHGRIDCVMTRPITVKGQRRTVPQVSGIPQHMVEDVLVLDYGDNASLDVIKAHGDELAAVIVEPVQSRNPYIQPKEFLHQLRKLTKELEIALIFDETITGFRTHPGGAQAYFGVEADLTVYGKTVGGTMPLTVLVGKASFMDAFDGGYWSFGDDSFPEVGVTYLGGTYLRHPIALAASYAMMKHMKQMGPKLQERLNEKTTGFVSRLNEYFDQNGVPMHIDHFSSLFIINFRNAPEYSGLLFHHLRLRGVHVYEDYPCFLSTAHTDEDIEFIIGAFKDSIREMQEGGFLPVSGNKLAVERHPSPELTVASNRESARLTAPTESQKEILMTTMLGEEASCAYNLTYSLDMKGSLNVKALRQAFGQLIDRHDSLRMNFAKDGSGAEFAPSLELDIPLNDLASVSAKERDRKVADIFAREARTPFDYTRGPLLRANLILLAKDHHILVFTIHHLICDGFSIRTVMRDLSALYAGVCQGRPDLPKPMQYREYIRWQLEQQAIPQYAADEAFWLDKYAELPPNLEIPSDRPRSPVRTYSCGEVVATIPQDLVKRLKRLGGAENCTLFSILLAALNVLLHRLSGQSDIVVGTPVAGQSIIGCEDLVGHCVNMQPFRSHVNRDLEFRRYLEQVQRLVLQNYEHRQYTVGTLIGKLEIPVDSSPFPSVQLNVEPRRTIPVFYKLEVDLALHRSFHSTDIAFNLAETDDGMDLKCWFNRDLFETVSAQRWVSGYLNLLEDVVSNPAERIENLPVLQSQEKKEPPVHKAKQKAHTRPYRLPMTDAQQEIWIASQLGVEASCTFNISTSIHLKGPLKVGLLRNAMNQVCNRHEALRTTISKNGDYQRIAETLKIDIPLTDLSGLKTDEREDETNILLKNEVEEPFDLVEGPLFRVRIIKIAQDQHLVVFTVHHIISDGWSLEIIIRDLSAYYSSSAGAANVEFKEAMQFSEFATWQENQQSDTLGIETEAFWLEQFSESVPALELPADRPRPHVKTYPCMQQSLVIDSKQFAILGRFATENGCTIFSLLLAAYFILLQRLSGQEDIVVGLAAAGQSTIGNEKLVGHCVNVLPLRNHISADKLFSDFLASVRNLLFDAFDYQHYSFGSLVKKLNLSRDVGRIFLISTIITYETAAKNIHFEGLNASIIPNLRSFCTFDLELYLMESNDELIIRFDYNTDLFDDSTIRRWLEHYQTLLEEFVAEPEKRLSEFSLLTDAERHKLLIEWNDTVVGYPQDRCIHELFEDQADQSTDHVAVTSGGLQLTFAELNQRANQLAHFLNRLDVGPGALVGLCLERSLEAYVAMLGVLKSGAAYLPLDPAYPRQRLGFMLKDSRAAVLLASSRTQDVLPEFEGRVIYLDRDWEAISAEVDQNPVCKIKADDPAYVIYTSGSTGKPKGVIGVHRGAVNRFRWMWKKFPFKTDEVCCQKTALSFVDSIWEIFGPLLQGIPTVIIPENIVKDPQALIKELAGHSVTRIVLVPSLLQVILDSFEDLSSRLPKLSLWVTSGESIPRELAQKFNEQMPSNRLLNLYGSSEVSADCTCFELSRGAFHRSVPIGRPIDNTQIFILDAYLNPSPVGVKGELYVGGDGLAQGYYNRAELTAERFIDNPFIPGERLFRTGDLARYLANGNIEFLGRIDHQVKIRGNRIELGDIETALAGHPYIKQVVVLAREEENINGKKLVAYLVSKNEKELTVTGLRKFLIEKLPDYMIPSSFVMMDEFPLTPNAKIDRKAFPAPNNHHLELNSTHIEHIEPTTETEQTLANIWKEVLNIKKVGIHDNFFELGGHSLLAIRLITQIERKIGQIIPLVSLFQAPTIKQLADVLCQENIEHLWSSLVKIQDGNSKRPLFCVHAAEGNVFEYHALAKHLDPGQPVYGMQAAGLEGKEVVTTNIEEIASQFIKQIKTVQPEGPYFLLGYCFGGVVAFEIANQLKRLKEEIALLALINTPAPGHIKKRLEKLTIFERLKYRMMERIKLESANLSYLNWKNRMIYIQNRTRQLKLLSKVKSELFLDNFFSKLGFKYKWHSRDYILQLSIDQRNNAYMKYKPKPLTKQLVLFRVIKQSKLWPSDPCMGWKNLIDDTIIDIEVNGYHKNILLEPNVKNVAEKLQSYLKEAQDTQILSLK